MVCPLSSLGRLWVPCVTMIGNDGIVRWQELGDGASWKSRIFPSHETHSICPELAVIGGHILLPSRAHGPGESSYQKESNPATYLLSNPSVGQLLTPPPSSLHFLTLSSCPNLFFPPTSSNTRVRVSAPSLPGILKLCGGKRGSTRQYTSMRVFYLLGMIKTGTAPMDQGAPASLGAC